MTGVVKTLDKTRGFGFIRAGEGGREFFFHKLDCAERTAFNTLEVGQAVTFDEGYNPRGPRAENVAVTR